MGNSLTVMPEYVSSVLVRMVSFTSPNHKLSFISDLGKGRNLEQKPGDGEITADGFHRILSSMETDIHMPIITNSAGWRMNKKCGFHSFSISADCEVIYIIVKKTTTEKQNLLLINLMHNRYVSLFK